MLDPLASVIRTAKLVDPAVEGVPVSNPEGESVRPIGRLPDSSWKVYGDEPPVACKVAEYVWFARAAGRIRLFAVRPAEPMRIGTVTCAVA